jgi:RNA polymerase sigma-70 factor, ECF subfamily
MDPMSSAAAHVDPGLIARLRAGDESAFEHLVRRYHGELCRYAARIDPSVGSAEEIVQEVFFRVWMNRERLLEVQTLGGYLYAAVRNYALNRRRRARHADRWRQASALAPTDLPSGAGADEDLRSAELAAAIDAAVAELPPRCRQAFLLRRREGRSYGDIARIMNTTPKTVEVQIGKALKLLRHSLSDWL